MKVPNVLSKYLRKFPVSELLGTLCWLYLHPKNSSLAVLYVGSLINIS